MSKGVFVALSGAIAQERAVETVASNVANASSVGYQRMRPIFRQALAQASGASSPDLRYAAASATSLDTTAGPTRVTERGLDMALPQGTYFAVSTPAGERYSRDGRLKLDREGQVVTDGGAPVASEADAPIKADPAGGAVRIEPDGTISQGSSAIGKLKLVTFEKPDALQPEGAGLLAAFGAGAATPSTEQVTPGALEDSNAQPVASMTELMTASRTFEAFQKVLEQFSEIDRKLLTTVPSAVE